MKDVTKESCTLKWRKPEDDGGLDIDYYQVEKQEDDGRWVPVSFSSFNSDSEPIRCSSSFIDSVVKLVVPNSK